MFNLFKKKKAESTRGDHYLSLKVREVIKETPDTVTLLFDQPDPYLEYKPGQFLTVVLEINGKEVRRSYSLCTSPFVDPYPGITVKRVKGGLVSNYLNDQIRPGKTIEVMKPLGNFTSEYHSKNQNHFVMITGGSGITPIMGIAKSVLVNEPLSKISLIYCSRSEEQIIFKKELDTLQNKYPGRMKVVHNLSQPGASWTGLKGRLDAEKIIAELKSGFFPEAEKTNYYVCGPQGLMDLSLATLEAMEVKNADIHKESFFIEPASKTKENLIVEGSVSKLTREVEVILEGKSRIFEVSPEKTILDAGLDVGVDMPYSCQSGLCTACRGKLITGQVKMNEDAGLSENEIAEGYILCCSSKPISSDVKIVIE
ncbi:ferredoxin--NADP reductase [Rhodonellum sp.]|uniref:ferredoxin--NADP reductase n=1 Tax=Rhodonellum sp. TaxID=2231180 RepID=UPI00271C2142|nr:ferredoxin--NADP reductase [Rhodonellum sp.]MDO9553321.1 ferredoxin--NADP reductase [Rhodonellum sp.]